MKVSELLNANEPSVGTVLATETIRSVVDRFKQQGAGALVVRGEGHCLDGIITERDVTVGLASHGRKLLELPASALMTTAVVSCAPEDSITEVAKLMSERHLGYIPVKQEGHLVGVVTIGDVLKNRLYDRRRATRAVYSLGAEFH